MGMFGEKRKLELPEEDLKIHAIKPAKGDLVKDKITGFTGVVICVLDYLHGCTRLAVQSTELKDGLPKESQYFDEYQVEIVTKGFYFAEKKKVEVRPPGGDTYIHDPGPEYAMNRKR